MRITIRNCKDKDFLPFVRRAAKYYDEQLVEKRVSRYCNLNIVFKENLKVDGSFVQGSASVETLNRQKNPRGFLIEIHAGLSSKQTLLTLAHEMVHVKQYIHGELDTDVTSWYGEQIEDDVDYWSHPWEIDAYGRAIGLCTKFAMKEYLWEVFSDFNNPNTPIKNTKIKWKYL